MFEAETPMQVIVKHLQAVPVRPSLRLGRSLPAPLEDLVLRCLAKDPDDRPSSALELAAALAACAGAEWSQADARNWWDRHAATIALGPPASAAPPAPSTRIVPAAAR